MTPKEEPNPFEYTNTNDFTSMIYNPKEEPKQERVCNNCGLKESEHNVRHPFIPKQVGTIQKTLEQKLDKIVSKEPSKFWAESDERFKNKETLEELANKANGYLIYAKETKAPIFNEGFIEGYKSAQEQNKNKYSEEEMFSIISEILHTPSITDNGWESIKEWYKQFKNK